MPVWKIKLRRIQKSTLTIEDIVIKNEVWCRIHEALESPGESVLLEKAEGKICRNLFIFIRREFLCWFGVKLHQQEVLGKIRRLVREAVFCSGNGGLFCRTHTGNEYCHFYRVINFRYFSR